MFGPETARPGGGWRWVWPLLLLAYFVLGLGRAELFDVDEGAFSEATREMVVSGDWGHTTLNGADRFDKPIGVYWLQALSVSVFGVNEFATRLPSALAAWVACLALAAFVRERWGDRPAWWAAAIHASSFGPWVMAHASTADALLGLWLMLSALDLWRYLEDGRPAALRRLALWVGLGVLTKGPVAVLIPLAALGLSLLSERRAAPLWQALRDVRAWLILLAVAAPWYAYALWRHGWRFIEGFILRHNLDRFSAPMEGHDGGLGYFLLLAPLLWLPWSALVLALPGQARALWQDLRLRRALLWAGFVLVFFSLSATKLPHYALYAAPGMALLLVHGARHARAWVWALVALALLAWHGLMLGLPAWLVQHPEVVRAADYQALLREAPLPDWTWPVAACWALAALAWIWQGQRQGQLAWRRAVPQAALLHGVLMAWWIMPWWAHTLQAPVRLLGEQSRALPGVVVQWQVHQPSFGFYRQQPAPRREPAPGEHALVRRSRLPDLAGWPVLAQAGHLALVQRPARAVAPEGARP